MSEAAEGWAADALRLLLGWQQAAGPAGEQPPDHPPECRYCPVCQGLSVLRRVGPDVLDQISVLAEGLAEALRAQRAAPGEDVPAPGPTGPPRLQRIEIDEETDTWS